MFHFIKSASSRADAVRRSGDAEASGPLKALVAIPFLLLVGGWLLVGGVRAQEPAPTQPAASSGMSHIRQSIEAHGGSPFEDIRDIAVSFSGRWGRIGPRLQPILADREFRVASEERYLLASGTGYQWHVGPEGEKTVLRSSDNFEVRYNGRLSRDRNRLLASAASIDLYEFLLMGPAWLTQRELEAEVIGTDKLGGEPHLLVRATIEPGFGAGSRDEVTLWLRESNHVLQRVEASLNGYPPIEGRRLEITLGGHQWIEGKLWPTEFLQRVDAALKVVYHRWQLTGLDINRGLELNDLLEIKQRTKGAQPLRPARALGLTSGN